MSAAADAPPAALRAGTDLQYTLRFRPRPLPMLEVQLLMRAAPDGTTKLHVSDRWAGTTACASTLHQVQAAGASSGRLAVTEEEAGRWTVSSKPAEVVRLSYFIVNDRPPQGAQSETHYRPYVGAKLLHVVARCALVVPSHFEHGTVHVGYQGFGEAGLSVASSLAGGVEGFDFTGEIESFLHSVFVGADQLFVAERAVAGHPVRVAVAGAEWKFAGRDFADLAVRIVEAGRTFFRDFDRPPFFISLAPLASVPGPNNTARGTGLHNAFMTLATTNLGFDPRGRSAFTRLLAHELLHQWFGDGVRTSDDPEALGYWFTEGFTEFYTRRLLLRAGLITLDEWMSDANQSLADYYASPLRNEPNERVAAGFWKRPGMDRLPYVRGNMVALLADLTIRRDSGGRRSLDDVVYSLLASTREKQGAMPTTADLLALLTGATTPALGTTLSRLVIDGVSAQLPAEAMAPCLRLTAAPAFELGFDRPATFEARKVTGVIVDSAAWRAGLRDGQTYRGGAWEGRPDRPARIDIRDAAGDRSITWMPTSAPVPQLALATDAPADCRTRL